MESLECSKCHGIVWTIEGTLFETGGTYVELFAVCQTEGCNTTLRLGVVDGNDIGPIAI
jgi:hypothetical protein